MKHRNDFAEVNWDRIKANHLAWWAGELDRPLIKAQFTDQNLLDKPAPTFVPQLPMDTPVDEVLDRYEAQIKATQWFGDALPVWWPNFGAGALAACMGAQWHVDDNTVWFETEAPPALADIHPRVQDDSAWTQRIKAMTQAAAQRWKGRVCVGYTDIGGNFDIAAPLRGTTNLLTDLLDDPDAVARVLRDITREWLRFFDEIHELSETGCGHQPWAQVWHPGRSYMFQSDFAYMISPDQFEQFVVPDLTDCCARIEGAFYHLDGKGQLPHLPHLLAVPGLKGVQWIPGNGMPPAEEWPEVLQTIRDAGKLCQLYVTIEGARQIIRRHGGKGFLFQIWGPESPEEMQDAIRMLQDEARHP